MSWLQSWFHNVPDEGNLPVIVDFIKASASGEWELDAIDFYVPKSRGRMQQVKSWISVNICRIESK